MSNDEVPPIDHPEFPSVRTLNVRVTKPADPGIPAEAARFSMVLPEGIQGSAVLDALTPLFAAQNWSVSYAYTELVETSRLNHANP